MLPCSDIDPVWAVLTQHGRVDQWRHPGGFETAHAKNIEQSTIATAMHDAGYTTGLFGKYLNGYPNTVSPSFVPPG